MNHSSKQKCNDVARHSKSSLVAFAQVIYRVRYDEDLGALPCLQSIMVKVDELLDLLEDFAPRPEEYFEEKE